MLNQRLALPPTSYDLVLICAEWVYSCIVLCCSQQACKSRSKPLPDICTLSAFFPKPLARRHAYNPNPYLSQSKAIPIPILGISRKLEPPRRRIDIPPHNNLLLPLTTHMLHPHLLTPLRLKPAYKHRIPQFTRYTQVLAAAH